MTSFRTLACGTFLLLTCTIASADRIDEYVETQRALNHLPGVTLAVTQGGKIIKIAGYGLANVELSVPVTPQSVFQIQSVTKQFTATAIMMLVEQGKLSLADPISRYLEGTPESWKPITIRHLLNQTSGIKDFINEPTASLRLEVTEEEVLKATAARPLNFQPGERYAYSNTNYHLLAMILRKITGQWYGDFLRQVIFEPLGMRHTRIMSWTELVANRAAGYRWQGDKLLNGQFVAESILAYGGGGILSTAEDMAKWDLALRGERLLKRASLEQMWSPARLNNGSFSEYGFGWGIGGRAPHRFVSHSGGHITGFTSCITRFRDDDLSVIVLLNAGHGNPARMTQAIAALYIPALKPPERKPIEDKDPQITELFKEMQNMVRQGQLKREIFTPDMYSAMVASLPENSSAMKAAGALQATELLERKDLTGGMLQFLYRIRLEHGTFLVTMTLDKERKIAGLHVDEE
jgi:D-alanyl-D-alanine carboxypeptidase